jgi:predicted patatin/cPLA2 family phospholipase
MATTQGDAVAEPIVKPPYMTTFLPLKNMDLNAIDTLVLAGGGNRCWWQAGLIQTLTHRGWALPSRIIATSAGAAIATSFLTNKTEAALAACKQLYANNAQLFDWTALLRLKVKFAHQHIYPAWISSLMSDSDFPVLQKAQSRLSVAITQPARFLGLGGSLIAGSLAYMLDKKIAHSIHPRIPAYLGLRQAFFNLNDCPSAPAARNLLAAAAAAAPFMTAQKVNGSWGMDGGYIDNAPIPKQTPAEAARTLVLLTRHYPDLPQQFSYEQRQYWQPSQKIPVSTWDCRPSTTVDLAYQLGLMNADLAR